MYNNQLYLESQTILRIKKGHMNKALMNPSCIQLQEQSTCCKNMWLHRGI